MLSSYNGEETRFSLTIIRNLNTGTPYNRLMASEQSHKPDWDRAGVSAFVPLVVHIHDGMRIHMR